MEPTPFELTPKQKGILATLAREMGAYHLPKVFGITTIATQGFQQHGNTGLVHNPLQHDLVQVGPAECRIYCPFDIYEI